MAASRSGLRFACAAFFAATSACVFMELHDATSFSVSGRISGDAHAGVQVRLSGALTGGDRQTTTDGDGNYRFNDVPKGTYTVIPAPVANHSIRPASRSATVAHEDVNGVDFGSVALLQVYGRDMGSLYENVSIRMGGAFVGDAEVKVNGNTLAYRSSAQDGYYYGTLPGQVPAAGSLVLQVRKGDATVTGNGIVPEAPGLTSPADGTTFGASEDIVVTWTSSTNPNRFSVNAQWSCGTQCGTGRSYATPGNTRTFTIPARDLPAGQIMLSVFAYNDGVFSGDYVPYPAYAGMNIRAEQKTITISH